MAGLLLKVPAALILAITLAAGAARAQGTTGQLTGTIADPNGALVQNAAVLVRSRDTGLERQATTGEDGSFAVQLLPPGLYRVEVNGQGFAATVLEEGRVRITETATVQLVLAVSGGN